MFNWIVSDMWQYLEPINFVNFCKTELLEIELFDHLTLCKQMINREYNYLLSSGRIDTAIWMRYLDANKTAWEEAITEECCKKYWTCPGGNTPQSTNYTATCLPLRKLFKLDEPDTQDTAGEAETSS